jgi:hypothetical protein
MSTMNAAQHAVAWQKCCENQKQQFQDRAFPWTGPTCEDRVILRKAENPAMALKTEGEAGCKGQLVIDHEDNDNSHNPPDGSNHRIRCRGHNIRKNPRGAGSRRDKFDGIQQLKISLERVRKRARSWETENGIAVVRYAEMQKNKEAEPVYRKAALRIVAAHGAVAKKDLNDSCSELADCSTQAGYRYLDKLLAKWGGRLEYTDEKKTHIRMRAKEE